LRKGGRVRTLNQKLRLVERPIGTTIRPRPRAKWPLRCRNTGVATGPPGGGGVSPRWHVRAALRV